MIIFNPEIIGEATKKDIYRLLEFSEMQTRWNEEDLKSLCERTETLNDRMNGIHNTTSAETKLLNALSDFSYEEIWNLHRQIFEIDDRPANSDLIYTDPEEKRPSELGKVLDFLGMVVNEKLIQGVKSRD